MTPPASIVHNCDCMTFMRPLPDKAFDLAICDPPYGIGEDGLKNHSRGCIAKSREYTPFHRPHTVPVIMLDCMGQREWRNRFRRL